MPDPTTRRDADVAQDDLAAILRALGVGDHARPQSPHEVVWQEVLPAIERLRVSAGAYSIGSIIWPGLGKSVEEMGELLQVLGKLIASGGRAEHWDGTDLHDRALDEIGDVQAALRFLTRLNNLSELAVGARTELKYEQFLRWQLEHSREVPAPESGGAG